MLLLLGVVLLISGGGCVGSGRTTASGAAGAPLFLWEVRSGTNTVHLLGSIHFARADLYPLAAEIDEAFERSKYLVVEANISDTTTAFPALMEKAFYGSGDSIRNHVSAETLRLLERKLSEYGLELAAFETFKPWLLSFSLLGMDLQRLGILPQHGIDMHFLKKAGKRQILELESSAEQTRILDGFDDAGQEALLRGALADFEKTRVEMEEIIDSWKAGDTRRVERVFARQARESSALGEVYDELLGSRNRRMVTKIDEYLRSGETHFVVVGAGHLVGREGLVTLLRERGYRPVQVRRRAPAPRVSHGLSPAPDFLGAEVGRGSPGSGVTRN